MCIRDSVSTYDFGPGCGVLTEEVVVTVEEGFDVSIIADPPVNSIDQGEFIDLTASINPPTADIVDFTWTSNDDPIGTNSPNVTDQPAETTQYTVVATSSNGCTASDSRGLNVIVPVWEIPTAFTPDGDNLNDEFGICLLYTSPSPRDRQKSRMPSSA